MRDPLWDNFDNNNNKIYSVSNMVNVQYQRQILVSKKVTYTKKENISSISFPKILLLFKNFIW